MCVSWTRNTSFIHSLVEIPLLISKYVLLYSTFKFQRWIMLRAHVDVSEGKHCLPFPLCLPPSLSMCMYLSTYLVFPITSFKGLSLYLEDIQHPSTPILFLQRWLIQISFPSVLYSIPFLSYFTVVWCSSSSHPIRYQHLVLRHPVR